MILRAPGASILRALVLVGALAACRTDRDGDGYVGRDDCNDEDRQIYPGAPERCNGVDDDCDDRVDEDEDVAPWFVDADGDGHGDPFEPSFGCLRGEGVVPLGDDCDDRRPDVYPGAPEACDGRDQDCDGVIDEDPDPPLYVDDDADGWGDEPTGCIPFAVAEGGDCDDDDPDVFPGAPERCNGRDDDCDGVVADERDDDGDGVPSCDDCDDHDPSRAPTLTELCNGIDDDCDGIVDPPDAWWDARWPLRVPVRVTTAAAQHDPITFDLDARDALDASGVGGAFLPGSARAVLQDCGGAGLVELPLQFLDHAWGLGEPGTGDDPEGDERGAVVILYDLDGDLNTIEPLPAAVNLAVYLAGPDDPPTWSTHLTTTPTTIDAAGVTLAADPAKGGLFDLFLDGSLVASQGAAARGNGIRTPAGPLSAQDVPGVVTVLDASPLTAALRAEVVLGNAQGQIAATWTARRFAGRPEVWIRPRLVSASTVTIEGPDDRTASIRPWQVAVDGALQVGGGLLWADVSTDEQGLAWRWVVPPAYVTHVDADNVDAWAAANDISACCIGTRGTIGAGVAFVNGPSLAVWPHGAEPVADWATQPSLVVDQGQPEAR